MHELDPSQCYWWISSRIVFRYQTGVSAGYLLKALYGNPPELSYRDPPKVPSGNPPAVRSQIFQKFFLRTFLKFILKIFQFGLLGKAPETSSKNPAGVPTWQSSKVHIWNSQDFFSRNPRTVSCGTLLEFFLRYLQEYFWTAVILQSGVNDSQLKRSKLQWHLRHFIELLRSNTLKESPGLFLQEPSGMSSKNPSGASEVA